jgi:hypothetical protein
LNLRLATTTASSRDEENSDVPITKDRPEPVWYGHDQADAYLLAAVHHLARAATNPVTEPLPPPSATATLYCAFAAEAYVNAALLRLLGETEYAPLSRIPVRSKYYIATRLAARQVWISEGERVLEELDELFTQRNRLVHAQPEPWYLTAPPDAQPEPHKDLRNVARWVAATAEAVSRLGRSYAEFSEFERISGPLNDLEPLLRGFEPERDGQRLEAAVRKLLAYLLRADEKDFLEEEDLEDLISAQDPDWDLRGLE